MQSALHVARRQLSSKAGAAAKAPRPRPVVLAQGDTRYVVERRAWLGEVSKLRKSYRDEQAEKVALDQAASAAATARMERRRDEARDLKQSRAAGTQARIDEELLLAEAALEQTRRQSAVRALAVSAEQRAHMATRVVALAAESKAWLPVDKVDERIGADIFARVCSPVNDMPSFARAPAPGSAEALGSGSGVAPDSQLLADLAQDGSIDLPVWLRHTLVGPSGKAN
jgi:hypothetical protein